MGGSGCRGGGLEGAAGARLWQCGRQVDREPTADCFRKVPTHVVARMPRPKGARQVDTSRVKTDKREHMKTAPSPKTPKQTPRGQRPRVSFSPDDTVHQFSVLQGDLDERREHWHKILEAAALYNSDEDDAFDDLGEETVDSVAPAVAAVASAGSDKDSQSPDSGPQRRSSLAAGLDDDEAPRYSI